MNGRRTRVAAAVLLACAAFVGFGYWANRGNGASFDVYAAHYPNVVHALRSLQSGQGLLWNNLQNCGQPFIPTTLLGLFYPPNWIFLWIDLDVGYFLLTGFHLTVAAVGMYAACRDYGLSRNAAVAGGLSFALGGIMMLLARWQPATILGSIAWLPAAAAATERIMARPTPALGVALGVALTLQLLAAYPQHLLFSYMFVAFRLLWGLMARSIARPRATLLALSIGAVLPLMLGAIQLVPMMELAGLSLRSGALTVDEIKPSNALSVKLFLDYHKHGYPGPGSFLPVVACGLGALGMARVRARRLVLFSAVGLALCLALSFDTPLQRLYISVWPGSRFRYPDRILCLGGFFLGLLVAYGASAVLALRKPRQCVAAGALVAFVIGGFHLVLPHGLKPADGFVALALLGVIALGCWPTARSAVAPALLVLLALDLGIAGSRPDYRIGLTDGARIVRAHDDVFREAMKRSGLNARIYQIGYHEGFVADYGLTAKSAQIYGFLSPLDYEPQTTRRYAELIVSLVHGRDSQLNNLNQFAYFFDMLAKNRDLLDLLGASVVIADERTHRKDSILESGLPLVWRSNGIGIYENPRAWPRAFYVPRAEVSDAARIRELVVRAAPELRRAAFLEQPLPEGLAAGGEGTGDATVTHDDGDNLVISARATHAGFIVLSDQFYPGWKAEVNGVAAPIFQANYAFRAVPIPAGTSTVVFRYRPSSVLVGACLSSGAVVGLALWLLMKLRRRRKSVLREAPA